MPYLAKYLPSRKICQTEVVDQNEVYFSRRDTMFIKRIVFEEILWSPVLYVGEVGVEIYQYVLKLISLNTCLCYALLEVKKWSYR